VSGDFTVELREVFRGPMDLLLHLVKEQEVEIQEVEIHKVIEGYFEYLENLEALDIEVAGDFLVLAATLMSIKARSLLPREEVELEDGLDPEDELIQRLMEYRRFKEASEDLDERWKNRASAAGRGWNDELDAHEPERTLDLGDLGAWDLLAAFSRLMRETMAGAPHRVRGERRALRWYVRTVGGVLREQRDISLEKLVRELPGGDGESLVREDVIGVFCALLELVNLGLVAAHQETRGDTIWIRLRDEIDEAELEGVIGASTFMDEDEPQDESAVEQPVEGPVEHGGREQDSDEGMDVSPAYENGTGSDSR
jgi:segregation and condensation protein A